jgi:inosine-uridine nucleoside N-ribohydrolase
LGGVALWLSGTQTEFNFSEDVAAARIVFKKVKNITWIPGPGVA